MDVGNDFGLQSTANLLEALDYSVIDKDPISWKGTLLSTGFTYRVYLPGCLCMLYANVLAYNTERVEGTPGSSGPTSLTLGKFPGGRGLHLRAHRKPL